MKLSEICRLVIEENSVIYYRYDKRNDTYVIKFEGNHGKKRGWTLLDNFSASTFLAVWKYVNRENQDKLDSVAIPTALKIAFTIAKKYGK